MPSSDGRFDARVAEFLRGYHAVGRLRRVLDVGAGMGKYARMVRAIAPGAHLTALEPWAPSIEAFGLRSLYDEVIHDSAEWIFSQVDSWWDVAIFGDVLEHMRRSDGEDLLHFLRYRTFRSVVVWPHKYRQGSYQGNAMEAHISSWDDGFFEAQEGLVERLDFMRLGVIPGYLGDAGASGQCDPLPPGALL